MQIKVIPVALSQGSQTLPALSGNLHEWSAQGTLERTGRELPPLITTPVGIAAEAQDFWFKRSRSSDLKKKKKKNENLDFYGKL